MMESGNRFSHSQSRRIAAILAPGCVFSLLVCLTQIDAAWGAAPDRLPVNVPQPESMASAGPPSPSPPLPLTGSAGGDLRNLPLRGLTGTAGPGVYPQLDKGLLVTPGFHPEKLATPLQTIIESGTQLTGKVERAASPRGKYQGLLIVVENNCDRPVVFDGDAASVKVAGAEIISVPMSRLAELSVLPEQSRRFSTRLSTDLKATTFAALTVGWAQTIRDQIKGSGPIIGDNGGRYGLDEQRRADQLRRFGKRVLWPGETTAGVLYFDSRAQLSGAPVSMPISSYYDQSDRGVLSLSR